MIGGGDLNIFGCVNRYNSSLLKDYVICNYMGGPRVDCNVSDSQYTFIQTVFTLDCIVCSNSLCEYVTLHHVFEEGSSSGMSASLA